MSKKLLFIFLLFLCHLVNAQVHTTDLNGLKTTVINTLSANGNQAFRYEIATLGYNSNHWQPGGVIIIELFCQSYGVGYEKYILENGYGQGANYGIPSVKLVQSQGIIHNAKLTLGAPYDLSSAMDGYVDRGLPIYLDILKMKHL